MVYGFLTFMVLPLYVALERMDWRLVEAARDLYASGVEGLLARDRAAHPLGHRGGLRAGVRAQLRLLCGAGDPGRGQDAAQSVRT